MCPLEYIILQCFSTFQCILLKIYYKSVIILYSLLEIYEEKKINNLHNNLLQIFHDITKFIINL